MVRTLAAQAFLLVLIPAILEAQDSGPGPVAPATSQSYDITTFSRSGVAGGGLAFTDGESANGALTNGALEATLDDATYSGDWFAYDLGPIAIWFAKGTGDAGNLAAIGYATPELIIGRASVNSASSGFWLSRLLSRRSVFLYGEAAAAQ
jgi:hypothetical protein